MTRVEVLPDGWNAPMCIADCHTKHAPTTEAERVANARLIAAAPLMLAALQAVMDGHSIDTRDEITLDQSALDLVAAAIAKAEGR